MRVPLEKGNELAIAGNRGRVHQEEEAWEPVYMWDVHGWVVVAQDEVPAFR